MFDTAFWIAAGSILALLVLSAFFSGSETALTAASRGKLRAQADKGSKGAGQALRITEDNERLIGSVLLGNNLVNILATSLATALFTRAFGKSGVALATLVMTVLVLVFAEVLPKTYAITNAETAASRVAPVIHVVVLVFAPVVAAVRLLVRLVLRAFRSHDRPRQPDPRRARRDQGRDQARPFRRDDEEGGSRSNSRSARSERADGRGDHAAPQPDRDDRREPSSIGDPGAKSAVVAHAPAAVSRRPGEYRRGHPRQGSAACRLCAAGCREGNLATST